MHSMYEDEVKLRKMRKWRVSELVHQHFYKIQDLVQKISPSVKFRFREDPTNEIYTIQPSGVSFHRRLRWSDGDKMIPGSGEPDAYDGNDHHDAKSPQLSPNFTMGYKTTFKNVDLSSLSQYDLSMPFLFLRLISKGLFNMVA